MRFRPSSVRVDSKTHERRTYRRPDRYPLTRDRSGLPSKNPRCALAPARAARRIIDLRRPIEPTSTWLATASRANRRHRSDRKDAGMKCGGNQPMRNARARASVIFGGRRTGALSGAVAGRRRRSRHRASGNDHFDRQTSKTRFLALGIGKSVVIDLPRDAKDVLVADPKIANAVVRSSQRAYIIGARSARPMSCFSTPTARQVASYDIAVKRDLNGVRAALQADAAGNQYRGRRRRRDPDRLGIEPDRGPAGRRPRRAAGRRRRKGRQLHRRPRPRSGDAQGHGRRSAARHHQATRRRSEREHELRHRRGEFQQQQSVHRKQRTAGTWQ